MKETDELEELIDFSLPISKAFHLIFALWKSQKNFQSLKFFETISKPNKKKLLELTVFEYRRCIRDESKAVELEALAFFYFILNQL